MQELSKENLDVIIYYVLGCVIKRDETNYIVNMKHIVE